MIRAALMANHSFYSKTMSLCKTHLTFHRKVVINRDWHSDTFVTRRVAYFQKIAENYDRCLLHVLSREPVVHQRCGS